MFLDAALLCLFLALLRVLSDVLEINRIRHESAVLLQDLADLELIAELETVIIQEQSDLCSDRVLRSLIDRILGVAVTLPVNRLCVREIRFCVDCDFISDHESGVEAETEMTDDIISGRLVLVLLDKLRCAGKCDLCDVLDDLVLRHADTVIRKGQRLRIRINRDMDFIFIVVRRLEFADALEPLQLRDCVAGIRDLLADKDIAV